MVNEKLDNEKKLNQGTEKTEILPEKKLSFNEDWSVTFPEVTLSNPLESLKYAREQEKAVISKLRESNEYVISEVKEILEQLFNWWSWKERKWYGGSTYTTSKWHYYENYESYKRGCFVDEPIEFLENYEWSLSKFMDKLDEKLKEDWMIGVYKPKYISVKMKNKLNELWRREELKSSDLKDISFVELFKEEIQNLSKMPESTSDDFYHLKSQYLWYIIRVCEDLWYKYW